MLPRQSNHEYAQTAHLYYSESVGLSIRYKIVWEHLPKLCYYPLIQSIHLPTIDYKNLFVGGYKTGGKIYR